MPIDGAKEIESWNASWIRDRDELGHVVPNLSLYQAGLAGRAAAAPMSGACLLVVARLTDTAKVRERVE